MAGAKIHGNFIDFLGYRKEDCTISEWLYRNRQKVDSLLGRNESRTDAEVIEKFIDYAIGHLKGV
jgi:hypothetical protein